MSALWPHPPYAEDQPHSHLILTTHVLHRGFQTGAILGPLIGALRYTLLRRRSPLSIPPPPFLPPLLRSTGTGALLGTGILGLALIGRMRGREDIEWRDRAWRLLENWGQVEVDGWSVGGMVGGGVAAGVWGRGRGLGVRGMVGSVGMGGTVGVVGYLGWRYRVRGGRWEGE